MKIHLHEEQFDGAWHAACTRSPHDPFPGEKYSEFFRNEEEFTSTPTSKRCKYCEQIWFPYGFPLNAGDG